MVMTSRKTIRVEIACPIFHLSQTCSKARNLKRPIAEEKSALEGLRFQLTQAVPLDLSDATEPEKTTSARIVAT